MILSAFLGTRYAHEQPLSLHASLVFEQSYGRVDGDSASLAELLRIAFSAGRRAPIRQSFALTGSVNQRGQVQAIGGVNERSEGFSMSAKHGRSERPGGHYSGSQPSTLDVARRRRGSRSSAAFPDLCGGDSG
ncbi:MAG: hypothetical protein R3F37_18720 [Candidatus Competibacteraceae bacterium]